MSQSSKSIESLNYPDSDFFFDVPLTINTLINPKSGSKFILMGHRLGSLSILFIILVLTLFSSVNILYPFRYLTNWGLVASLIYFFLVNLCQFIYNKDEDIRLESFFGFWKITVIFMEIAFCYEFVLSAFYWIFLYKDDPDLITPLDIIMNIAVHAVPIILLIIEMGMSRIPFYKNHFVLLIIFGLWYLLFNIVAFQSMKGIFLKNKFTYDDLYTIYFGAISIPLVVFTFFIFQWLYKRNRNELVLQLQKKND